jgi:hypothetical protein
MIVKKILRIPKDAILSAVAKRHANKQLEGIGKITSFSLNSINKKVSVSLYLLGEKEAIRLDVLKYDILKQGRKFYEINTRIPRPVGGDEWFSI